MPGQYPRSGPPAHIHLEVTPPGKAMEQFELVFEGDSRMTDEIRADAKAGKFYRLCTPAGAGGRRRARRHVPRRPGLRSRRATRSRAGDSGWHVKTIAERRRVAVGALEGVVEAVAGEDLADQRQADALAARLGAEERREQVGLRLGGQAGPAVLDRQASAAPSATSPRMTIGAGGRRPPRRRSSRCSGAPVRAAPDRR